MLVPLLFSAETYCVIPVVTLHREKVTNTQNTILVSSFKSLFATTSFSCQREERNRTWTESIALDRPREINRCVCVCVWVRERERERERERADTHLNIIFLVVYSNSHMWLLNVFSSGLRSKCRTPSQGSLKMGAVIFGRLYIIASRLQLFFLLFSHPRPHGTSTWASFSKSQLAADSLLIHFYF